MRQLTKLKNQRVLANKDERAIEKQKVIMLEVKLE